MEETEELFKYESIDWQIHNLRILNSGTVNVVTHVVINKHLANIKSFSK